MADHARAARLAKRITQIVASAIELQIKDPRLAYVTITDCKVTGDLHDAVVYYTVRGKHIDSQPNYKLAAAALTKAAGPLRKLVGQQLGVRYTPTLRFELDTVPEASANIEMLLAKARAKDDEVRKLAAHSAYAGAEDPYKKPDAPEELDAK